MGEREVAACKREDGGELVDAAASLRRQDTDAHRL